MVGIGRLVFSCSPHDHSMDSFPNSLHVEILFLFRFIGEFFVFSPPFTHSFYDFQLGFFLLYT